ncbi:hypothetical protein B296_00031202 [Ensete ventricosum]|uniref:Uncharacterized protein n=1 Tax=Ensete ventricosum TaxID=4639 RepID=A0A426WWR3_ENSVE|nr:hypothetical protein B296_00031202 [Ensete ventricosum]
MTMWYQSGTSIRRNTRHTNVGDLARLCGGQPARVIQLAEAKLGSRDLSTGQEDAETGTLEEYATVLPFELSGIRGMIGAVGEFDCFNAQIHLREPGKSEDKAKKGYKCKSTDSRAMGLAAPWYRKGRTSMESSIPCSYGGRALVVKGTEEVENAKANSKYQDRAEGQRPRNFIRLVSMGFSSR